MNFTYREMPENYRKELIYELKCQHNSSNAIKDIILVIRNQYAHVKKCLESITEGTKNYRLFIWDNNSNELVNSLIKYYNPHMLATCNSNWGFIKPNNYLASLTTSPYIILINSDVIVTPGWADALTGYLENNSSCGVVGYQGGLLDENCLGVKKSWGDQVDYVSGWCMCIPRKMYNQIGLFDNNLEFAYGEDSDFSLQVKSLGYKVYALHLSYTNHKGGGTIETVKDEIDVKKTFENNHSYLKWKWSEYLKHNRILSKYHGKA